MDIKTIATSTSTTAARIIGATLLVVLALAAACVITGMVEGIIDIATGHAPTATAQTTTSALGCWNEPNSQMPGGYELIQGPLTSAPVGSTITDCPS